MNAKAEGIYPISFFGDGVTAAFSGREFGLDTHEHFLRELGIEPDSLVLLNQIHSANIVLVSADSRPQRACRADGMITSSPEFALGVLTADCVPVFLYAQDTGVAGIAHAGWKGICFGIVSKMMQAIRQNFKTDPSLVRAAIGPCIRRCCYEVGEELHELFPAFYAAAPVVEGESPKGHVDLVAAVRRQLADEGLLPEQIYDCEICTACSHDRFYSYRREKGISERMLSVIRMRKK